MCVCVCEREREREREKGGCWKVEGQVNSFLFGWVSHGRCGTLISWTGAAVPVVLPLAWTPAALARWHPRDLRLLGSVLEARAQAMRALFPNTTRLLRVEAAAGAAVLDLGGGGWQAGKPRSP